LREVSGQFHAPAAFTSGVRVPGTHWIGGWVGLRAGLDMEEKRNKIHHCPCQELNPGLPARSYPGSFSHVHSDLN